MKPAAAAAAAAATAAAASHDVDFVHLWRQLTAAGTRGGGCSTRRGDVVQAEEVVRSSQIDISVVFSQNTVDGIFCPSIDNDVELSQAAVAREFGLSLGDLQDHDDGSDAADAAAGLHVLSEASGLERGGELDDAQADLVAEQAAAVPFRRRLQVVKDDANILQDGEDSCDYENYSSGVSDGDGICDNEVEPGRVHLSNDEDVLSDSDAVEMDTAFLASLQVGNSALSQAAVKDQEEILRGMMWTPVSSEYASDTPAYPGLGSEETRTIGELLDDWRPPILTLFNFMPKSLWVMIAAETNRSGRQQVRKRARDTRSCTHEILHAVGLHVARMLCPQKRSFFAHWFMVEDGAVPTGSFDPRQVPENYSRSALRGQQHGREPSQQIVEAAPCCGSNPGALFGNPFFFFSFDEGVLSATSKRNTTRIFMSDKPHRYGSKLFMTCDAKTSYCHSGTENAVAYMTGAAAVVRNLKVVLADPSRHEGHAAVIDRYYSSVLLAVELLKTIVYVVGTVMTNRFGIDQNIKTKRKTLPTRKPRGTFSFSRSTAIPSLFTYIWWDSKPVYYVCPGSVMTESSVERKVKRVGPICAPCPVAIKTGWAE
ncbi:unnamed protein product [Phytophthora fragariaefolia]|uniref:Unnamed protein product n=1 Tax=Phytophthora fragariaefolia TaxID=1490495 RepID=A0A9W6Y1E4_9STRA|nr:unnamed protein product [Phytophthora fragariaefolia]